MSIPDAIIDPKAPPRAAVGSPRALETTRGVAAEPEETLIQARPGWVGIDWKELYRARELLYFLVWRDVKVRYKQTVLGFAWAVLQPLFMMAIFTFIFGRFAQVPSDGFPYPVFVYAGLLPWTFFANGLGQGGQCLISQQHLLTKIYFPRLFVPTAAVGAYLVDFLISLGIYVLIMAWFQTAPAWTAVALPALMALTIVATLGAVYTLSALTVLYRDFRYVIPFLVQILMYLSPVIFPVSLVPARFHPLLALNPMFGIIDAYRSAILGTPWNWATLGISTASALVLFVFGLFYFRKVERRFADIA